MELVGRMANYMDSKVETILECFSYEQTLRAKSDSLRWEAMELVGHRTKSLSGCSDSPVNDTRRYQEESTKAIETFVSGFMSALMPQNSNWFGVTVVPRLYRMGQSVVEDMEYSSYTVKAMMDEFSRSNFYASSKLASYDSVIGGYSCQLVQEDTKGNRTNYDTLVPWRCWFDCDRFGNWDKFFYKYTLNGYEMLERFPDMPSKLKERCKMLRSTGSFTMLFAIVDREGLFNVSGKELSFVIGKNMKYASLQICLDSYDILEESGYNDFPVAIHIWEQVSDSHYGIGLVMKYIAEFRRMRKLGYEKGITDAKINHPVWNVPVSIKDSFSDDPYARNYYTTPDEIASPAEGRVDPTPMLNIYNSQVEVIRRICYNDYMNFLTTHSQVYTATQVNQIKSESLAQIVPLSDNVLTQKMLPLLKLTYVNMLNAGRIERPNSGIMAEIDENGDRKNAIKFTFTSAMADQLMLYTDRNASQAIAEQASIWVQITQDPSIISKNFKINNILKMSARASGADASMIMTDEETEEIVKMEQQMAQLQQQLAIMQQASDIDKTEANATNLNNMAGKQ